LYCRIRRLEEADLENRRVDIASDIANEAEALLLRLEICDVVADCNWMLGLSTVLGRACF
jgi:hypothetical protein